MFSLCKVVALVAPIMLVACDPIGFEMSVGELFGVPDEVEEEGNQRAYDRLCFEGYVRSAVDETPISGASVAIIGGHTVQTSTESSGYYALKCAPHQVGSGAYLRARKDGWSVQDIRDVSYSIEAAQRYDFTLEPQ